MPDLAVEERYRAYRDAIRRRVCAICLDGEDDGTCGLVGQVTCAVEEHLPRLVDTVLDVRDRHGETYAAAVEARVCLHCTHRDAQGQCRLRQDGRCAITLYLPLLVEAIDEVERHRPGA
jgi:hypothetical protein